MSTEKCVEDDDIIPESPNWTRIDLDLNENKKESARKVKKDDSIDAILDK